MRNLTNKKRTILICALLLSVIFAAIIIYCCRLSLQGDTVKNQNENADVAETESEDAQYGLVIKKDENANPTESVYADDESRAAALGALSAARPTSIHVYFQNHDLSGEEMDIQDTSRITSFMADFFGEKTVFRLNDDAVADAQDFTYSVTFYLENETETIYVYHLGYGSYAIYFDGCCYQPEGDYDFETAVDSEWDYQVQKSLHPTLFP